MTVRPSGDDVTGLSLQEAAEALRRGRLSTVELTQACLACIERLNPVLNAFITVTAESALASARDAEADIHRGRWRGPLHGIPVALKDLFDTAGVRTTAASALFKDRVPTEDAEVVTRLKTAGAVILGKTNMHEFAYGGTSAVTYFGAVHNPWNLQLVRGVVMTALTSAAVWVPVSLLAVGVSSLFRTGPPLGISVTRFLIIQASLGAITGGVFSSGLATVGRRRTVATLNLPVVAACGAAAAMLVPVLVRVALSASFHAPLTAIVSTLLTSGIVGATCATVTLAIARRAPALPSRNQLVQAP